MPTQAFQARTPSTVAVKPVQPVTAIGPHFYSIYDTESGRELERHADYGQALAAAARLTNQNASRPT